MQTDFRSRPRRRHEAHFKAEVIAACLVPGATVAEVARSFGLNDNLVHQWRRGRGTGKASPGAGDSAGMRPMEFVAVSLPAPSVEPAAQPVPLADAEPIRIEIRRGAATVNVCWPAAAASDCAAWLREWLR